VYLVDPRVYLLLFVAASAVIDLHQQRIPNLLVAAAAAIGVLLNGWHDGLSGVLFSIAGFLTALAALLPLYMTGGFGAGDVKAMAAVGVFLGPGGALFAVVCTLMVGAAVAVVVALQRRLRPARGTRATLADVARSRFPYAIAIACGTAASLARG
jgi:prepilin peptidase CpaA